MVGSQCTRPPHVLGFVKTTGMAHVICSRPAHSATQEPDHCLAISRKPTLRMCEPSWIFLTNDLGEPIYTSCCTILLSRFSPSCFILMDESFPLKNSLPKPIDSPNPSHLHWHHLHRELRHETLVLDAQRRLFTDGDPKKTEVSKENIRRVSGVYLSGMARWCAAPKIEYSVFCYQWSWLWKTSICQHRSLAVPQVITRTMAHIRCHLIEV